MVYPIKNGTFPLPAAQVPGSSSADSGAPSRRSRRCCARRGACAAWRRRPGDPPPGGGRGRKKTPKNWEKDGFITVYKDLSGNLS